MKYAGLTEDAEASRKAHGKPSDWWQCSFKTEKEARKWLEEVLTRPNHTGSRDTSGWHFGYIYTISNMTTQ